MKRWCREDEIDYTRTPGGSRRIPRRELLRFSGDARPTDRVALYARVSSHGQKKNGDLDRQSTRRGRVGRVPGVVRPATPVSHPTITTNSDGAGTSGVTMPGVGSRATATTSALNVARVFFSDTDELDRDFTSSYTGF